MLFLKQQLTTDCHLGLWRIKEDTNTLLSLFHNSERQELALQISGFIHPRRQIEWLGTRLLLRELLNHRLSINYDDFGKPYLSDNSYSISISHSHEYIAVIVGKANQVGVDIELMTDRIEKIAPKFVSGFEFANLSTQNRMEQLYLYWCGKETLYKMYGKKSLRFIENIIIYPLIWQEKGNFTGRIKNGVIDQKYPLHYFTIKSEPNNRNFVIVWCAI